MILASRFAIDGQLAIDADCGEIAETLSRLRPAGGGRVTQRRARGARSDAVRPRLGARCQPAPNHAEKNHGRRRLKRRLQRRTGGGLRSARWDGSWSGSGAASGAPMTGQARGRFITLEGGEGAGKSVQAKRLEQRLAALGLAVVRTREPGGSPGAEALREAILSGFASGFQPRRAGVAVRRRPHRPSREDDPAGACERRLGRFRPVRRFDPGLSRRGGESAARVHRLARAPDRRREPARSHADPRPSAGNRP